MTIPAVFCIALVCLMVGACIGLFAGALASVSKDRSEPVEYPHFDTHA